MNFYPPKNKDFQLPSGEKSPLLVKIHGGPTSQAGTAFNLGYQFWTSRGKSLLALTARSVCSKNARASYADQACIAPA